MCDEKEVNVYDAKDVNVCDEKEVNVYDEKEDFQIQSIELL